MEESIKLTEDGDPVTFTFCDHCNPDWDPGNSFELPPHWAERLKLPVGTKMLRGVFQGISELALKDGWAEREYGHICPVCMYEVEENGGETWALDEEGALDFLTGKRV